MSSAYTDSELQDWLRCASESGNTLSFVRTVAEAAFIACSPDYDSLRPTFGLTVYDTATFCHCPLFS